MLFKYGHAGGVITINAQIVKDSVLRINVIDNGPGIPEEHQALIFEPFNRLGAEYSDVEGTGIGLTIARQLVER